MMKISKVLLCNYLTFASAAMNPARCFGVFVATSFPTYHWIHWVSRQNLPNGKLFAR